jgi:hypothetical protein
MAVFFSLATFLRDAPPEVVSFVYMGLCFFVEKTLGDRPLACWFLVAMLHCLVVWSMYTARTYHVRMHYYLVYYKEISNQ